MARRRIMAYTLRRPPETGILRHWLGRFYLWLTGWQIIGDIPPEPKIVVVAGFHTSNWDGWNMLMSAWVLRVRLHWMVKAELMRPPLGWILRPLGGVAIDRQRSQNTVNITVEEFNKRERFLLCIAPEGTRKKIDHWRTGFYWIAVGAGVPLKLAMMDYASKTVNFSAPLLYPSGDIEADMREIWGHFEQIRALHPERVGQMKLRPSALRQHGTLDHHQPASENTQGS